MRETFLLLVAALVSVLLCGALFAIVLSFVGCSSKEIVEVKLPVPVVCEYNLTKSPVIRTSSTEELLETITNLSYDGRIIRDDLRSIPCLDIKEVK